MPARLIEISGRGNRMRRPVMVGILWTTVSVSVLSAPAVVGSPEDSSLLILGQDRGRSAAFNGRAFFVVDDGAHGEELWVSDGGDSSAVLLRDIHPGPAGSAVTALTVVGNRLLFSADDGVNGQELWRTDGTRSGTVLVADIDPGPESSAPLSPSAIAGWVYFSAFRPGTGREL